MEDLRETGEKVIESIKNKKPADVGDLVLGISAIIEELRREKDTDKIDHLEGLFGELVYDKPYELREVPDPLEGIPWPTTTSTSSSVGINPHFPGAVSGLGGFHLYQ